MNIKKNNLVDKFNNAVKFHTEGKFNNAKELYIEVLKIKPDHFLALSNLGIIYSQTKHYNKAVEIFNKVLKINPKYSEGYNNLGNVFFELLKYDLALENYKKAIKLNPKFSNAYNNIGNIYFKRKNLEKAIESYNSAILYDLDKTNDKSFYNLGNIYRELDDIKKSIECYQKAIKINPNSVPAYINLSISLSNNGDIMDAIHYCQKALNKDPKNILALNNLGKYFQEIGKENLSVDCYQKGINIDPTLLKSRWLLMNTFPIIYKDFEQIEFFKKNFEKNIFEIENILNKKINYDKEHLITTLSSCTNFYLHYQADDVTHLQKKYGDVVHKLTKRVFPQFQEKIPIKKSSKSIKVGFISSYFYDHVVSKLFKNWIANLNKDNFKTYVHHIGQTQDETTILIKKNCHSFSHEKDIYKIINNINSNKLDVLIFLDIGMDPKMQILGNLKLAPIQCCAYGVPVTTGFKNIDYFLSSELMETKISQKHYSEKLIKLPDLGIDYDAPKKSKLTNSSYKKEKDKVYFLNLQSNYKLLPQHDHIYFEIIKNNPSARFWFLGTKNDFIASKFKERIATLCNEQGVNLDEFFTFYPQMTFKNYLNLIENSDIILDSIGWSGLNTSLEAISLNKPIVTLPSNFMRGRHTFGILKVLKIDELICNSKEEYVSLASKLSKNLVLREEISKKIKVNKKLLFNNPKPVKFLEKFLESLF